MIIPSACMLPLVVLLLASQTAHGHPADKGERDYHPMYQIDGGRYHSTLYDDTDWAADAQEELRRSLHNGLNIGVAKNVIIFVGDGMGVPTTSAARFYKAQRRGEIGREAGLAWDGFAHTANSMTYSTNKNVPDSAATATAFLTGEKTRQGLIGVNQKVTRGDCASSVNNHLTSILEHALDDGKKWTGIITTTRVTHATPASAYAHSADREWETDYDISDPDAEGVCKDIARQLVEDHPDIRVLLGGGRRAFYPNTEADQEYPDQMGRRTDGRDLVKTWIDTQTIRQGVSADQVKYVISQAEFDEVDPEKTEYLLGLFEPSYMKYETDRANDTLGEPSLTEMVEKAINILKRNPNGFFLEVEGGNVDLAHHDNLAYKALNETVALSDAVQRALEMTSSSDTLIVVTADHSHTMTFNGYADIDNDIMGLAGARDEDGNRVEFELAEDMKPYTTLSYANGQAWYYHRNGTTRKNLTEEDDNIGMDPSYLYDAAVPTDIETHGGEDVQIFANGPMSYLFHGTQEENYIAHVMMYASCLGPNKDHCDKPWVYPGCPAIPDEPGRGPPTGGIYSMWTSIISALTIILLSYIQH